ncbi:hypothetical protein [Thalassospira permensis]|uniref:Uncharacterized protein n=1 Tax=Thalassospira permensis NBRC 106175 TaxID=1353532 RepID=A0ABR4TTC4_9PROT|nr:hypothetical protein [Thalassospira permensis]KEO58770.1 hypothetical protein SMB34_12155 [Thalassospira permensis NBRC 106175]
MKSGDWNTILLIVFGCLLGFAGCVIFFPGFPPMPDGWGSILGSTLGVAGAFLVANWTFTRRQKAEDAKSWRPFHQRCELAMYMLPKAETRLHEATESLKELYDLVAKANSHRPLPYLFAPKTVGEMKKGALNIELPTLKKIHEDNEEIQDKFQKFSYDSLDNAIYSLRSVGEALEWITKNMEETLPPIHMFSIKNALQNVQWARHNAERARTGPMNWFLYTSDEKIDEREAKAVFLDAPNAAFFDIQKAIEILSKINLRT